MATADELLDLAADVSTVAYSFRFDLLTNTLHADPAGPLRPSRASGAPTMANRLDDRYPRTVRGFELDPDQADQVDVLSARVAPFLVLDTGDEYPLGVFLFDATHRLRRTGGSPLVGGLIDQSFIVDQGIEAAIGWPQGYNVTDAMAEVVALYTLPRGFDIVRSSTTLGESIAFRPSTSGRSVLERLAELAGYLPPYFDNNGVGQLRPSPAIAGAVADHVYADGGRIVKDSIVESDDLLDAPNVWVATSKSASSAEVSGSYLLPSSAPHSVARRGFRVPRFVSVQGLGSGPTAAQAAQAAAASDVAAYQFVEFDSSIDPRHDTAGVVDFRGTLYLELGWSFEMRPGAPMHHELRRVYL